MNPILYNSANKRYSINNIDIHAGAIITVEIEGQLITSRIEFDNVDHGGWYLVARPEQEIYGLAAKFE